jgi:hypothetical protein
MERSDTGVGDRWRDASVPRLRAGPCWGKSETYIEAHTTGRRHAAELAAYEAKAVLGTL